AIADFSEAVRLAPTPNPVYYTNRGDAYYWNKNYDLAIPDFDEAIRMDSKQARAYNLRGNCYYAKNDSDRAIADYTEAIRINPHYAVYYNNRGYVYYQKKDYDKVI